MRTSNGIASVVTVLLAWLGAAEAAPSAHEKAARELCRLVCGAGSLQAGGEMMTRVVNDPEIADLADVYRGWYVSVMALWDRESAMAPDYMAAFSESELREILDFYRTPLGGKALTEVPALARREAAALGREMTAHQPELEAALTGSGTLRTAAAAQAAEPTPEASAHEQAARALYREIGGAALRKTREKILAGVRESPPVAHQESLFRDWYDGLVRNWDREGEMAQHFKVAFSEQELRDLLAFFQTPAGRKLTAELPGLVDKEAERSRLFSDEHLPELEILIGARRSGLTHPKEDDASPP